MTKADFRRSTLSDKLVTGVLHFGLGAFHRAHQAVFVEDAIAAGGGDWGIEAVSMRNRSLADNLNQQDCRYTLIERTPDGPRLREISAIRKAWWLPGDGQAIAERFADPAAHLITITVTEKGYCANLAERRLNLSEPVIVHDLENPDAPKGLLGILALGLAKRRISGGEGMTLISCDNLTNNGELLRSLVIEFVERNDPGLADWIGGNCSFPSTMVDRITPASTEETFALVKQELDRNDPCAVDTEPFSQWVIENDFAGPRPDLEASGVLLVEEVAPYEIMKLRMLNGAHSMIAYIGSVGGFRFVRDVMAVPELSHLVREHMMAAAETLTPLAGISFSDYADDLIARFANPEIDHACLQIAMDGSQKMPQRIFAPAMERIEKGLGFDTFAFATALWMRHIALAVDEKKSRTLEDALSVELLDAIKSADRDPRSRLRAICEVRQLALREIFENEQWFQRVLKFFESIESIGAKETASRLQL